MLPAPSFSEYSRALRAAGCEVTELLTELMKNAAHLDVCLEVEAHTGETWLDAK